ncbi:MAG TPA: TonB-dependent receptor [Rhizomicrobium sp.]|jgi:TonB-dependent receptor
MRTVKYFSGVMAMLLTTAAWPAVALAQSADAPADGTESVTVIGSLAGVHRAMDQQRQATTVQNVVSSDDFAKLPDFNAAESLQRLPGVSLVEDHGEGRFVSIRGARPNYNGTLLDGFTVPTADRSENRVDLQTLPNALIERIEVNKTMTPDMPSEGIGGSVNIVPRNPATIDHFIAGGSVYGGFQQNKGGEGRVDGYIADNFGPNNVFGFALDGSFRQNSRQSYETRTTGWSQVNGSSGQQVWSPSEVEQVAGAFTQRNTGVDAAVGAAFDHFTFELRGFYSESSVQGTEDKLFADFTPAKSGGKVTDFDADGGLISAAISRDLQAKTWNLYLEGVQTKGRAELSPTLVLDFGYAYQQAREEYPDRYDIQSKSVNAPGPLPLLIEPERVALGPFDGTNVPSVLLPSSSPVSYYQPDKKFDRQGEHTPYVNLAKTFAFDNGDTLVLKGGLYYRIIDQGADIIYTKQTVKAGSTATFADVQSANPATLTKDGVYFGTISNADLGRSLTTRLASSFNPSVVTNPRGLDPKDFDAWNDIKSYYAMGTWQHGDFTAIAGARLEEVKTTFLRTSTQTLNGLQYFDGSSSNFMPSVHLRYDITPELQIRASWSNTMARPDPQDIYSNQIVDDQAHTITTANPSLKPLKSQNWDASVDWYFGPLGYLTAGVFAKNISNYPLVTQSIVQVNGIPYTQTQTQSNAGGKLVGYELAYRQQFDELPGLLSGLGVEANYAKIWSNLKYALRPDGPPLGLQPSDVLNAALVYAHDKVFARLSVAYVGPQIDDGGLSGTSPALDIYIARRTTLDLSMSYDLDDQWQVYAEGRNLTNAPEVRYTGNSAHMSDWESFGMAGGAGVRVRF